MDFVGKRAWFFLVSLLVIAPGILFLIIAPGLKPGIDFTGGSTLTLDFLQGVDQDELRLELARLGQPESLVQQMSDTKFFVRTKELQEEQKEDLVDALGADLGVPSGIEAALADDQPADGTAIAMTFTRDVSPEQLRGQLDARGHTAATIEEVEGNSYVVTTEKLSDAQRTELIEELEKRLSRPVMVLSFDLVSPAVASETVVAAMWAVLMAAVGVFLYLWWAFRNVPSPFRYGAAAVLALVHDAMIVIGIFAILGELFDVEVNTMFMIALLTVIGYSVNDTIVIFDRIRENVLLNPNRTLAANANISISQSLGRSLNTSFTLLFTLLALLLFGGETIRAFVWVLLIGVIVGTYSSIAIATNALVAWESGDLRRALRRLRSPARTEA